MTEREGSIAQRMLPDGRELVVYPLFTGTARLVVGQPDDGGAEDAW